MGIQENPCHGIFLFQNVQLLCLQCRINVIGRIRHEAKAKGLNSVPHLMSLLSTFIPSTEATEVTLKQQ